MVERGSQISPLPASAGMNGLPFYLFSETKGVGDRKAQGFPDLVEHRAFTNASNTYKHSVATLMWGQTRSEAPVTSEWSLSSLAFLYVQNED